jgi:hypothetical protein
VHRDTPSELTAPRQAHPQRLATTSVENGDVLDRLSIRLGRGTNDYFFNDIAYLFGKGAEVILLSLNSTMWEFNLKLEVSANLPPTSRCKHLDEYSNEGLAIESYL